MIIEGITVKKQTDGRPALCNGDSVTILSRRSETAFNETVLQKYIAEHPNMLPIQSIEPGWKDAGCVARELPTTAGPVDLLLVNQYGRITIVETKLYKNPEGRREVLAQSLDYAAAIHNMTYEELGDAIRKKRPDLASESDPLIAAIEKAGIIDDDEQEFDPHAFRERVEKDLELGQFLILIVGDEIKARMRTIINYFDKISHLGFQIGLVSVQQWESPEGLLVLVPQLVTTIEREVRIWTPDPNSQAAQEIAHVEESFKKTSRRTKRPSLSDVEARQSFESTLSEIEDGDLVLHLIMQFNEECAKLGFEPSYRKSGASVIYYHNDPEWDGEQQFNLLGFHKTGIIGHTGFLQHRCTRPHIDIAESIWKEHWNKLGKITNAGSLQLTPTSKVPKQHSFLDANGSAPRIIALLGKQGENISAVAELLAETADKIQKACEGLAR